MNKEDYNVKRGTIMNQTYDIVQKFAHFDAQFREGKISYVEYCAIKEIFDIAYDTLMKLNESYKNEK